MDDEVVLAQLPSPFKIVHWFVLMRVPKFVMMIVDKMHKHTSRQI